MDIEEAANLFGLPNGGRVGKDVHVVRVPHFSGGDCAELSDPKAEALNILMGRCRCCLRNCGIDCLNLCQYETS